MDEKVWNEIKILDMKKSLGATVLGRYVGVLVMYLRISVSHPL